MISVEEANYLTHLIGKCACGNKATRYIPMMGEDMPFCEECFNRMVKRGEETMQKIRKKVMDTYGTLAISREQFDALFQHNSPFVEEVVSKGENKQ